MTPTPYQIVVPLLAAFAVIYAWNLVSRQKKTVWEAVLWTVFWGWIASLAVWPNLLSYMSSAMGFKNRENAVFITSIGILFFMMFYLVIRIEELEQKQTKMIRQLGLKKAGLEKEEKE